MDSTFKITEHPHRRMNPLTGEWILVSPHRTRRPWQGKVETLPTDVQSSYDPVCYLCPGNKRIGDTTNPDYKAPYAFTNDFGSLMAGTPAGNYVDGDLLRAESVKGLCRVIFFSPDHAFTLPQMQHQDIVKVIDLWQEEYRSLSANEWIKHIQIFENKGAIMGCSNPHPHGQIWALTDVPSELIKETINQKKYFNTNKVSLIESYSKLEIAKQERIVCINDHFIALVSFWAVWPFVTMIISRRQVQNIVQFTEEEKQHWLQF